MGKKLNYFCPTLKVYKYPHKRYCLIVLFCLRTVRVVYFITIVATNRNKELLTEQVINTDQMGFMSNRVGYNYPRLFTVVTKATNIKDKFILNYRYWKIFWEN